MYYKEGQDWAAFLYYKAGQVVLQNRAGVRKRVTYYKVGQYKLPGNRRFFWEFLKTPEKLNFFYSYKKGKITSNSPPSPPQSYFRQL